MTIYQQTFTTGQIVEATGVTNMNLQNWLKRNLIVGQKDIQGGGSPGRHRQYSFFNLIEIAMAKALTEAGMTDMPTVFQAASSFSHGGTHRPITAERLPGMPFDISEGRTLLIAGPQWSEVIFFKNDESAISLFAKMRPRGSALRCVVIDATDVFLRVIRAIGLEPHTVIREAYEKNLDS